MTAILEYYNDYNQHGGYFLGVFDKTVSELEEDGWVFGRQDSEYSWKEAVEIELNKVYDL